MLCFAFKNSRIGRESESHSVMPDYLQPHGLYRPWNSPGQNNGVRSHPPPGDLPNPGIEPRSNSLQVDSLPAGSQGSPGYWSGQPIPSPADLPNPGVESGYPALQADSLPTEQSLSLKGEHRIRN